MAVVAACGNGGEPTSPGDEAPTAAPPSAGGTSPTASIPPATPIVSHGGPVKDYVSLVDNLRAAGAAIDPAGNVSQPFFAPQGQLLTVNGKDVQAFEFANAEEADTVAETVSADGSSIGTSMVGWVAPPHFYKADKLIVLYVGCDSDVISVLQETMGPQFAVGAGVSQCPERVPPTNIDIRQAAEAIGHALEAANGSEVTVSGFLIADKDGNTRLCSGLLESYPPQCGGDRIDLLGFDASSVPDSKTSQSSIGIQTARWTDSYITVTGIKGVGGLIDVRLSTQAPTPQEVPDAPAPTKSNPQSSTILTPTPTLTRTFTPPDTLSPTPTPPPPTTSTRELALSVLDRQCTASHTTKIPSSPGLLCSVEAPNLAVYSDGLVIYHVWERKYYGSRIGGELHVGQLDP